MSLNEIAIASSNRLLRRDAMDHPHIGAGVSWNEVDFDSSGWASGRGPFGFGYGQIGTDTGSRMFSTTPSLYVRREFNLTADQAADPNPLTLLINYDDGVVLYLNGVEVARRNLGPTNLFVYADQSSFNSRTAFLSETLTLPPASTLLRPGRNVLAAQIHNFFPGSDVFPFDPDFFFYADLTLSSSPARALVHNNDTWSYHVGVVEPSGGVFDPDLATLDPSLARFSGWVELHNSELAPVSLDGWSLTDNASKPRKWVFPNVQIPADGYLVVLCSGLDRRDPARMLHAGFELEAAGGYLGLYDTNGIAVSEFKQSYPAQSLFHSYGLDPATGSRVYFATPTPGKANQGEVLAAIVEPPSFSLPSGFYDQDLKLRMRSATAGAQLRYTVDGTEPTERNGADYTAPIQLVTNAVVRVRAFRPGWIPSTTTTATYLLRQPDEIRSLPAVMLAADPGRSLYKPEGITAISGGSFTNEVWSPQGSSDYDMALLTGGASERPASLEILRPSDGLYRQIDCGLQLSASRWSRPRMIMSGLESGPWRNYWAYKPSMSFYFRGDYGAGRLRAPLFPGSTVNSFDELRLRAGKNDWGNPFVRDETVRRIWLDMGGVGSHGLLCNLWVNSEFKGFFNLVERLHEAFFQSWYGGTNHWDVRLADESRDGDAMRWGEDMSFVWQTSFSDPANYAEAARRFDLVNFADYCLLNAYCAMWDWPENNFYMARERVENGIWRFHVWDAEGAFGLYTVKGVNYNTITNDLLLPGRVDTNALHTLPALFTALSQNPEFRLLVADRALRHLSPGGALDETNVVGHYSRLKAELDPVMLHVFNQPVIDSYVRPWAQQRPGLILGHLAAAGLWPGTGAPKSSQPGGLIIPGTSITLTHTNAEGTIYYTLDGSDPRGPEGLVAGRAYAGPIAITEPVTLRARVLRGGEWSPVSETIFRFPAPPALTVTEINYQPTPFAPLDGQPFEFVEIHNPGPAMAYLAGVSFIEGIDFSFPPTATLAAGAFAVVAKDAAAFSTRYPGVAVLGQYSGKLDNAGERLTLAYLRTNVLFSVRYDDAPPWPSGPAGGGFTLVPSKGIATNADSAGYWTSSVDQGGSPGRADPVEGPSTVLINELLPRPGGAAGWQVELYNPSETEVDVGGWSLTDSNDGLADYRIPARSVIAPHAFLVLTAEQAANTGAEVSGLVSPLGGILTLSSRDAAGNPSGFDHAVDYPPTAEGNAVGRFMLSTGEETFTPMKVPTLGSANATPRFGPVILSEIHYHPAFGNYPFIEVSNSGTSPVALYNPALLVGWRVSGIGFSFPPDAVLGPGESLLISSVDPAVFRVKYDIPASVRILGPWDGTLQEAGEQLTLERPIRVDGFVVETVEDAVRYSELPPWPANAAGSGASLQRISPGAYGNEPLSWRASSPNPGRAVYPATNPQEAPELRVAGDSVYLPLGESLSLSATLPPGADRPDGVEFYADGVPFGADGMEPYQTSWTPSRTGSYELTATSLYGDESLDSDPVVVRVLAVKPEVIQLVPAGSVWKYRDDGVDLGDTWWGSSFDDASWKSGPAQLGYGDGDERTLIGYGPDASNKYVTAYFRLSFVSPGTPASGQASLGFLRDDGGIVYLNGKRVVVSNMPEDPVGFGTLAGGASGAENIFVPYTFDASAMVAGTNQFAVEVHQNQPASSDLSFDLTFAAPVLQVEPWIVAQPVGQAASAGTNLTLHVTVVGRPLAYQWYRVGAGAISGATNSGLQFVDLDPAQAGDYYMVVSNLVGSVTSATARLSVGTPDTDADGIPDYWERRHGLNPGDGADASADPDSDGLTNLEEYRRGLDPAQPDLALRVAPVLGGDSVVGLDLSFLALSGIEYRLERRLSVASSWQALYHFPSEPINHRVEVRVETSDEAAFYRIVRP